MATLFSQGFVDLLTPIFVFIFLFAALWALLMKTKLFGDKPAFITIIAFAAAMLVFIVPETQVVVATFTPWIAILTILVMFIFVFFLFLGVKEKTMTDLATGGGFAFWAVLIIVIIFLISLTKAFGPFLMANQHPGFWNAVKRVVFHPKTLGALFILMVASYTIRYIGSHE